MCTSGFAFRSPLSGSNESTRSRYHESPAHHIDPGFFQQPGDQGSHMDLPLRGSQAPLVLPVQPAGPYSTTDRSMAMETSSFRMAPILNATQALSSHMAPYSHTSSSTHAASPRYVATPPSVASPSYMAIPSSMASPFSPVIQHAEATCLAELDEIIRRMLAGGASTEVILSVVKTHKDSKDAGIHHALDTMSMIQTEALAARINAIGQ
jgi:hypothetical protein